MSRINFVLSRVEHEKSFITSGLDSASSTAFNVLPKSGWGYPRNLTNKTSTLLVCVCVGSLIGIYYRPRDYKTFILNSAEPGIYPAHNVKMPTIVGILTFISMITTTSEVLKARNFFNCRYYSFL